MKNLR